MNINTNATSINNLTQSHSEARSRFALYTIPEVLAKVEGPLMRYGLALILAWIGAMKFTAYEANGIRGFEANSPLFRPLLEALGTQPLSNFIGVIEILTAVLLIAGAVSPRLGIIGSTLAAGTFLATLTFLFTTPGWEPSLGGFPALSAGVGQFLLKDIMLLSGAVYTARESLAALRARDASQASARASDIRLEHDVKQTAQ